MIRSRGAERGNHDNGGFSLGYAPVDPVGSEWQQGELGEFDSDHGDYCDWAITWSRRQEKSALTG